MFSHFKMDENPFIEQPPVERIYKDDRINQGLARLQYFLTHGLFALLIGHTGVGKSSLIRLFLNSLPPNKVAPVCLHLTNIKATGLLRLIVSSLGEIPRAGKDRLFLQIMDKIRNTDLPTLLIIDEAHLLSSEALTDLRLLVSGVETNQSLKVLLSGQEPLSHILKRSIHTDLAQRVNISYYLRSFNKEQTSLYIDSRLQDCGTSEKIFDSEAKNLIHDYSHGVPRQINNLATSCLLNAVTRKEQKITPKLVNQTISETFLP